MPSLVTDNFRVFAAQQFIESLEEPFTGVTPDSDSSTSAQSYRSKLYLFIGRSYDWNDPNEPFGLPDIATLSFSFPLFF